PASNNCTGGPGANLIIRRVGLGVTVSIISLLSACTGSSGHPTPSNTGSPTAQQDKVTVRRANFQIIYVLEGLSTNSKEVWLPFTPHTRVHPQDPPHAHR